MRPPELDRKLREHVDEHGFAVIAEIGQNHNGSADIAKALAVMACRIPQVFGVKTAVRVVALDDTPRSGRHSFGPDEGSHRAALELDGAGITVLRDTVNSHGKTFGLSFVGMDGLARAQRLCPDWLKVASRHAGACNILNAVESTDMGYMVSCGGVDEPRAVMLSLELTRCSCVFDCAMAYPSPPAAIRISAPRFWTASRMYGLSSHCRETVPDMVAFGAGARVFERHVTLDTDMDGTDHAASLTLPELRKYCNDLSVAAEAWKRKDGPHHSEMAAIAKMRGTPMPNCTQWVGVDLDGTLAEYEGSTQGGRIGKPRDAMLAMVRELLANGDEVRIVTARVASTVADRDWQAQQITQWLVSHLGEMARGVKITAEKDKDMLTLYDDRARRPL